MGRKKGKRKQNTGKSVPPQLGESSSKRIPEYRPPAPEKGADVIVHGWGPFTGGLKLRFDGSLDVNGVSTGVMDTMFITRISDNALLAIERLPANPTRAAPYIGGFAIHREEMTPARVQVSPGESYLVKPFHQKVNFQFQSTRINQDVSLPCQYLVFW